MSRSHDELVRAATSALRRHHRGDPDDPRRSDLLKEAAAALVDLREHYLTQTGEPDWPGRTAAYKRTVGDVYRAAGFTREEQATTSGAVRYHAGNYLRRRLSPDEIDALGMSRKSPRDRHIARRAQTSTLLHALRPGSEESEALADLEPRMAAAGALSLLQAVTDDSAGELTPAQRRTLTRLLTEIGREMKRIRAAGR